MLIQKYYILIWLLHDQIKKFKLRESEFSIWLAKQNSSDITVPCALLGPYKCSFFTYLLMESTLLIITQAQNNYKSLFEVQLFALIQQLMYEN